MTFLSKRRLLVLAAMILGAFSALLLIAPLKTKAQSNNEETYRQLTLFGDVFQRVREDYVEEVSDQDLVEAAINGMLTSLDPHSAYLPDDNFQKMQVQTRGKFGGLGIEAVSYTHLTLPTKLEVLAPDPPNFHSANPVPGHLSYD